VEASTQDDTPQCFLLTPKLLPELTYTPDVQILQIMNGPYVAEVSADFSMVRSLPSYVPCLALADILQNIAMGVLPGRAVISGVVFLGVKQASSEGSLPLLVCAALSTPSCFLNAWCMCYSKLLHLHASCSHWHQISSC
jgi:hypothetical protein